MQVLQTAQTRARQHPRHQVLVLAHLSQVPAPPQPHALHVSLLRATIHTTPPIRMDRGADQVSRRKYESGKHFVLAVNASHDGSP